MGLEAGVTKLSDLDVTWPLSSDLRHYGDDHLRNLKIAVKSLLPGGVTEQLSHADMLLRGTNTHAQIDTHITTAAAHIADTTKHLPAFVDRGDPSAFDKIMAGFTIDAAWHDWDLSAIVPAGAKAVLLYIDGNASAAGHYAAFRENGNSNAYNVSRFFAGVSSEVHAADLIVACDANRVIEYFLSTPSGEWVSVNVLVRGWIL